VDGVPSEYLDASRKVMKDEEQFRAFEAEVRSLYERMARISITPEWAKMLDFQTRLPSAVEQLVNRKLVNLDDSSGGWMADTQAREGLLPAHGGFPKPANFAEQVLSDVR
ncbi:MAG TPA: hypothetical protein VK902_04560, partial [Rubrobacter sp.]|nr:hypothetical protein [Rubrobacter sp.]